MPIQTRIVAPGPNGRSVRTADGEIIQAPEGWKLLPPCDTVLTRRGKADEPSCNVQEKKGHRILLRSAKIIT
jgi:hypothetical protein